MDTKGSNQKKHISTINREKREPDYPVELESQFILRLPEEPARSLKEVLKSGEYFKNRLTIQIGDDMRHGEVRFDHWLLHGKIVDLPTIVESMKTIDRKSLYKTADICQIMICKDELEPAIEEESPAKNKKKDSLKVDKKFLFPHGITPPTKNVRKRRFRKTLKKKSAEAPEIEKEVKRLLRADNEAESFTWEVTKEEDEHLKPESSRKTDKHKMKKDPSSVKLELTNQSSSKVEDIFGEAVSDSDLEDENVNVDIEDNRMSSYDDHMSDSNSMHDLGDFKGSSYMTQFKPDMFQNPQGMRNVSDTLTSAMSSHGKSSISRSSSQFIIDDYLQCADDNSEFNLKLQQLATELEELKQRRQKTQQEIAGMENMALRQRFQDNLYALNQEIKFKEHEYKNLQYLK